MEHAVVTSETSVHRLKMGRPRRLESSDGRPSKSSGLVGEKLHKPPTDADGGSGDGSFDDFDNTAPKKKRKREPTTQVVESTDNQSLIDIVKFNGRLIPYAVKRLVEQYEVEPKFIMVEILMMLFKACGAKYQLNVGSLDETEVDDVVVSLVELARNGEVLDNYNSKQKELKKFKENLGLFWDKLVLEC